MNNSSEQTAATSEDVSLLIHNDREQNPTVTSQEDLITDLTDAYNKAYVPHKYVASAPIPSEFLSNTCRSNSKASESPVITTQEDLTRALTDAYNKAYVPHKYVASDPIPSEFLSPFYSTKHSLFASLPSDLQEDETPKPTFK